MWKNDKIQRRPFPDILAIHKDSENMAKTIIRCKTFIGNSKNEHGRYPEIDKMVPTHERAFLVLDKAAKIVVDLS